MLLISVPAFPLTFVFQTHLKKNFFLSHFLQLIDLGVYNSVVDEVGSATETADWKSFSKSTVNAALGGSGKTFFYLKKARG